MTGRRDNAVLRAYVEPLDKQGTELHELGLDPLPCLMIRDNGVTPVDQGFDVALVS